MLAVRNESVGTIELPKLRNQSVATTVDNQDKTLAELFSRLGQSGELSTVANSLNCEQTVSPRHRGNPVSYWPEVALADVAALQLQLEQELALVMGRLQR